MSNHSVNNQQSEAEAKAQKIYELRVLSKQLRKTYSDVELIKLISIIAMELESNCAMLDISQAANQYIENYRLSNDD